MIQPIYQGIRCRRKGLIQNYISNETPVKDQLKVLINVMARDNLTFNKAYFGDCGKGGLKDAIFGAWGTTLYYSFVSICCKFVSLQ